MPAGAILAAGAISAAGPGTKAAGPDPEAAGPDFESLWGPRGPCGAFWVKNPPQKDPRGPCGASRGINHPESAPGPTSGGPIGAPGMQKRFLHPIDPGRP